MATPDELMQKYGLKPAAESGSPKAQEPEQGSTTDLLIRKYGLKAPDLSKEPNAIKALGVGDSPDDSPDVAEGKANALATVGMVQGVEHAFAGVGQMALQALAKIGVTSPETTEAFTRWQMDLDEKTGAKDPMMKPFQAIGEGMTYLVPSTAALKVPEILGKAAPKVMRLLELGSAAGVGGVIGGSQFQEKGQEKDRWGEALKGAGLGAAGELATTPIKYLGTKAIGSQIVQDYIKDAQTFASNFKEAGADIVNSFKTKFLSSQRSVNRVTAQRNSLGDQAFPAVDTTALVKELTDIQGTGAKIGPEIKMLTKGPIKVGGTTVGPQSPLYAQIVKQAPEQAGVNYSTVANTLDRLRAGGKSEEAVSAVKNFMDDLHIKGGKGLKDVADEAEKRKEALDTMTGKDFKSILEATGPQGTGDTFFEANKKLVGMAMGEDAEQAGRLYQSLAPEGREAMRQGIMFHALDQSIDKGKVIDPAKLSKVLDTAGVKTFFNTPRAQTQLQGMKNSLNTAAQLAGKARDGRFDHLIHYTPLAGSMAATYALMRGNLEAAATDVAVAVGTGIVVRVMSNALRNSQRAENFFAAASKVEPGSPASIRIFNRLSNAFGAVSGGVAGGTKAGGEMGGVISEITRMGVEKGIEQGVDKATE